MAVPDTKANKWSKLWSDARFRIFIYLLGVIAYFFLTKLVLNWIIYALFSREIDTISVYSTLIFSLFVITALIFLTYFLVQETLNFICKKLKQKLCNSYIKWTITIFIIIFIIGLTFLRQIYLSPYPVSLKFSDEPNYILSNLNCESSYGYIDYVIGDNIHCDTKILSRKNSTFYNISGLQVKYLYLDEFNNWSYKEINPIIINNNSSLTIADVFIPIDKNGKSMVQFLLSFYDPQGKPVNIRSWQLGPFYPITFDEYRDRHLQKLTFLIGLFSISIFSILSAINNLKNIVESTKEDKLDNLKNS